MAGKGQLVKVTGVGYVRVPPDSSMEEIQKAANALYAQQQDLKDLQDQSVLLDGATPPEDNIPSPVRSGDDKHSQVRGLLDLILKKESSNNYDTLVGGKTLPLDTMTLDEVMDYQADVMGKKGSGFKSTAVGGYQFINTTLKYLKKRMGLTGGETLTPELQDEMATELLKRRGLDGYLSGKYSAEQFGTFIAKEWASFPVIAEEDGKTRGDSYHHGVGDNKALVSVEDVLKTLKEVKSPSEPEEKLTPVVRNGEQVLTPEGRPVYENQYGDQVTERTITENINGSWYNIPTVYDGKFVSPDEAIDRVLNTSKDGQLSDPVTGRVLRSFDTVESAVTEAESRSPKLFTDLEEISVDNTDSVEVPTEDLADSLMQQETSYEASKPSSPEPKQSPTPEAKSSPEAPQSLQQAAINSIPDVALPDTGNPTIPGQGDSKVPTLAERVRSTQQIQ